MEDIIKLRSGYKAVNYLKKMPKPDLQLITINVRGQKGDIFCYWSERTI